MNRFWVRLSLAFVTVVLLVVFLPFLLSLMGEMLGLSPPNPLAAEIPEDVQERIWLIMQRTIPLSLLRLFLLTAVVAIIAGVWFSRSLTAPVLHLERAARDIGDQDLSRRVAVTGSDEIQALAHAFNDMAAKLERAETTRRHLLSDVAHEIRTPLTVIQGNLRALLDDVYPLDKEEIARLYDQTRHLTRMVDDLHLLAQAEAHQLPLNMSEIALVPLVQNAAEFFRATAESQQVTIRVEILGKHPHITADAARLTQVLHNLLSNALRHTPAGGKITVQVEQKGEGVMLAVADTGEGIAPEHLGQVFGRFYRVDPARRRDMGGTGLGLALAKAMVEAHGGSITAVSAGVGQGTQFVIRLKSEA